MDLFNNDEKGAVISECGKYRYSLWRVWEREKGIIMFLMLNPSTADADEDDPTIRRCIGFAKAWGFGGIMVGNLFAYRATNPNELSWVEDPIGWDNQTYLKRMNQQSYITVCAWGASKIVAKAENLIEGLDRLYYLHLTKSGNPQHPLYLPSSLILKPYERH